MSLEYIVNKVINLDPTSKAYLQKLDGKAVQIICSDYPKATIFCVFCHDYLQLTNTAPAQITASITAPLYGLVTLAIKKHLADIRSCNLSISGDLATAELLQQLIFNLDIDWEEELSKFTGDLVAHQAVYLFKRLRAYQQDSALNIEAILAEYLQEEIKLLPTQFEVNEFTSGVDDLRLQLDRCEARLNLLLARNEQHESS